MYPLATAQFHVIKMNHFGSGPNPAHLGLEATSTWLPPLLPEDALDTYRGSRKAACIPFSSWDYPYTAP